jgi:hypothetical protein
MFSIRFEKMYIYLINARFYSSAKFNVHTVHISDIKELDGNTLENIFGNFAPMS